MVSVSDHETGGLTLARQISDDYPEYFWKPEVLHKIIILIIYYYYFVSNLQKFSIFFKKIELGS